MPGNGSANSSPVDFAFEPPSVPNDSPFDAFKTDSAKQPFPSSSPVNFTPPNNYNFSGSFSSNYDLSTASSFSSTSGSATGGSFSSVDALPAISRDFTRPTATETRRPATAGGALQSTAEFTPAGPRFQRISTSDDGKHQLHDVAEESEMFTDPFGSKDEGVKQVPSQAAPQDASVDPRFVPQSRRASEPHFNVPQAPAWQPEATTFSVPSAPAHASHMGYLQQQQQQQQQMQAGHYRQTYSGRPQTSDGLPSYPALSGNVSLPSAQSIARQIPGLGDQPGFFHTSAPSREQDPKALMPFRDDRSASMSSLHTPATSFPGDRSYSIDSGLTRNQPGGVRSSYMGPAKAESNELTFVQLGGPTPKKRPRRRFDEIERLYACGWNGCEKSYGTLNHLNCHVAMQKHGEKRSPAEFKEMRKAWRKSKREAGGAPSSSQYPAGWKRGSMSSESDWDRRDSSSSMLSASSDFSHRSSMSYAPSYGNWADSRPGTSGSMASSDGRAYFHPAQPQPYTVAQGQYVAPPVTGSRRPSAPQHLPMPTQPQPPFNGFRQDGDHPTPTAQNPFPQRPGAFPFNTLTSPMAGQMAPSGPGPEGFNGQFAFHR